jgi:regulator of chromosome condensation
MANCLCAVGMTGKFFIIYNSGQLGLPMTEYKEHCSTAKKLDSVPPLKHISCGSAFSLAISQDNDLWAWGYGEMGQLANENEDAPIPFQVELKGRQVLDTAAGGQHSVILLAPKE